MVCALHSNWQLCGKDALLFVLRNINSHSSVKRKEEEVELSGLICASRLCSTQHKHILYLRKRSPQMREMGDQVTSAPDTIDIFSCSMSKQQSCFPPPCLSQEANMLSSINQTQSIDGYLANRSTNELKFDLYGILKSVNDVLSQEKSIFRYS